MQPICRALTMLAVSVWTLTTHATETALPQRLDGAAVAPWVHATAPEFKVTLAQQQEAAAGRIGAAVSAPSNPDLALSAGPSYQDVQRPSTAFMVTLAWPLDVSGAWHSRAQLAETRTTVADLRAEDASRTVVAHALELFLQAKAAAARVALEQDRLTLDETLVHTALVRRTAGTVGDSDLVLANMLRAEATARLHSAQATLAALQAALWAVLGWPVDTVCALGTDPVLEPLPDMAELQQAVAQRPDVRAAAAAMQAAHSDLALQHSLAWPVPKITVAGGRSPEYVAEVGIDVPLPVYQRNQTAIAQAAAHVDTAQAQQHAALRHAQGELAAACAEYTGAAQAFAALDAAVPSLTDAEHLATRGYELGQTGLGNLLIVRREVANARLAHLEAQLTRQRAALAVRRVAGRLP